MCFVGFQICSARLTLIWRRWERTVGERRREMAQRRKGAVVLVVWEEEKEKEEEEEEEEEEEDQRKNRPERKKARSRSSHLSRATCPYSRSKAPQRGGPSQQ